MGRIIRRWWRLALLVVQLDFIWWWISRNGSIMVAIHAMAHDPPPYVGLQSILAIWLMILDNLIQISQGGQIAAQERQDAADRAMLAEVRRAQQLQEQTLHNQQETMQAIVVLLQKDVALAEKALQDD